MPFTGKLVDHPAQYSSQILEVVRPILAAWHSGGGEVVCDPYAGLGTRLGALCDDVGLRFYGMDIEAWPTADERVIVADATEYGWYPNTRFAVVTSPPYFGNRISSDYVNGPLPTTKVAGRRSYGVSLGRPLHQRNLARVCKPKQQAAFYGGLTAAARIWPDLAVVNVDLPMRDATVDALKAAGLSLGYEIPVETQRYRGGAGSDKRAPHEVVLVANR